MQAIIKKVINETTTKRAIENVTCLCQIDDSIAIDHNNENGISERDFIKLDGYTEILIR